MSRMDLQYEPIRRLLATVRARHRAIATCRAIARAALLASAVIGVSIAAASVASIAVKSPLLRTAVDAASLALFPGRVTLEVSPGDTRVKEGAPVSIEARLAGNTAPVVARLEIQTGSAWRASEMASDAAGRFRAGIPAATSDFRYRVV